MKQYAGLLQSLGKFHVCFCTLEVHFGKETSFGPVLNLPHHMLFRSCWLTMATVCMWSWSPRDWRMSHLSFKVSEGCSWAPAFKVDIRPRCALKRASLQTSSRHKKWHYVAKVWTRRKTKRPIWDKALVGGAVLNEGEHLNSFKFVSEGYMRWSPQGIIVYGHVTQCGESSLFILKV